MISKGHHIVFVCVMHLCVGIWVTTNLSTEEIDKIFMQAREQGRSNAELMYSWTEGSKDDICKNVLISDSIAAMNIRFLDETDRLHAVDSTDRKKKKSSIPVAAQMYEQESDDPVYLVAPRAIIVGGQFLEVFGFPCPAIMKDKLTDVYIADGYLEKTYSILLQNESEKKHLSVIGFVEIPPEKQPTRDQKTLEELYIASLEALQVKTFLCWDEDESLINPITTLSEKEKVKLCSMVNDTIHSDFDGWVSGIHFKTADFEHAPLTFTALEKDPPVLSARYKIIRGIECTGAHQLGQTIHFILIPNWLQKDGAFVLKYSDSEAPVEMVIETGNPVDQHEVSHPLEKEQEASTSRKRKPSHLQIREKTSRASERQKLTKTDAKPSVVTKTTTIQKAVVLISHVDGVSILVNKQNRIHITI